MYIINFKVKHDSLNGSNFLLPYEISYTTVFKEKLVSKKRIWFNQMTNYSLTTILIKDYLVFD